MSYRGTSAGFTVETTRCLWQRVNCSRSAAICQEKIAKFFRIYNVAKQIDFRMAAPYNIFQKIFSKTGNLFLRFCI